MTWMTPLDAFTSGVTTFALFTKTDPSVDLDRHVRAVDRLRRGELHDLARRHAAGDHVVEQDSLQLRRVGGKRVERRLRHLREGLVGRGEHRERARALERVDEAGGREERGERLEAAVVHGGRDDVGLAGGRARRDGRGEDSGYGDDRHCHDECDLAHWIELLCIENSNVKLMSIYTVRIRDRITAVRHPSSRSRTTESHPRRQRSGGAAEAGLEREL